MASFLHDDAVLPVSVPDVQALLTATNTELAAPAVPAAAAAPYQHTVPTVSVQSPSAMFLIAGGLLVLLVIFTKKKSRKTSRHIRKSLRRR